MRFLRHLGWPIAVVPALAAFGWTSFAARLPESTASRQALGEATMKWTLAEVTEFGREPAHVLARLLHLGALRVPGSSFWWAAAVNSLLALLVVFAFAGVARRSFGLGPGGQASAIGLGGLLACSPAFGADWLYGARVGLFLVPLLLLWAVWLLLGERRFVVRALLALALVVAAPLCHTNGVLVFVAVAPALLEAARRAGSSRRMGWTVALLLCGNLAAVGSLFPAGRLALGDAGLLGRLVAAPAAALLHLLRTTGSAWLDPLPATAWDETALGACAWLLPLVLWRLGDRSDAARRRAAPWWGCIWFGLSLFLLAAERHGPQLDAASLRACTYGAFLLPIGCIGLVAARFGAAALPLGAGALAVLGAQDWHRGLEDLRLARMQAEAVETSMVLPPALGGTLPSDPDTWRGLQQLGWMPWLDDVFAVALREVASAPHGPGLGGFVDGDARAVRGVARSSLRQAAVQCVVATAAGEAAADGGERLLGLVRPDYAGAGRTVPWSLPFMAPIDEGTRVRITGFCPRRRAMVALAPVLVLRQGQLVVEGG
ncbi:MAG: hypothetical protein KF830_11000 [Planctomycetes bacterium]|nr:hypothetical protein [Planctomycetota bacterium]